MISLHLCNSGNSWEDEEQHQGGLNKDERKERMPVITLSPYLIYLAAVLVLNWLFFVYYVNYDTCSRVCVDVC